MISKFKQHNKEEITVTRYLMQGIQDIKGMSTKNDDVREAHANLHRLFSVLFLVCLISCLFYSLSVLFR